MHVPAAAIGGSISGGGGGGGGVGSVVISFSPNGGSFSTGNRNCTVTVTGAPQFRWNINHGAWTNATGSTVVTVNVTVAEKNIYVDALDGSGNVLASAISGDFFHDTGH